MDAALKAWSGLAAKYNGTDQWKQSCVTQLDSAVHNGQSANVFAGLINRQGRFADIGRDSSNVWGINMKVCYDYCGWDKLQTVFSFQIFSAGATNYLLPWLALTAQLPFETGEHNVIANFMSFCIALGSPMLITYSLMITILNQHWLRTYFRELERSSPIKKTIKNARMFLQESQQVPLRVSQEDGSLASLVVLTENKIWWQRLREHVERTRRGVTLSLIAQIIVAILSWVLTVIAAFLSSLGSPTEALILAGGSLWVWLVPVICGWISVGTQNDHSTIIYALSRDDAAVAASTIISTEHSTGMRNRLFSNATSRTLSVSPFDQDATSAISAISDKPGVEEIDPLNGSGQYSYPAKQKAFRLSHDKNMMQRMVKRKVESRKVRLEEANTVPGCFGFSIAGDEKQEGPTFNYARVFTWWHVAKQVHGAFKHTSDNLNARKDIGGKEVPEYMEFEHKSFRGDSVSVMQYCGLAGRNGEKIEAKELPEYPEWADLDAAFWQRNMISIVMAVFVQWGSTGAALTIAYLTEVIGLGCRSGSYVVYGTLGTISFLLLFSSSFFSHAAMLGHQRLYASNATASEAGRPQASAPSSLIWYRVCAVLTRIMGRILVVLNATWLILISFWELVGFFNNCWCDGVTLTKGSNGFIILFKDAAEMAPAAVPAWAGGVFLSISVVAVSSCVFWLFCRGNRR